VCVCVCIIYMGYERGAVRGRGVVRGRLYNSVWVLNADGRVERYGGARVGGEMESAIYAVRVYNIIHI